MPKNRRYAALGVEFMPYDKRTGYNEVDAYVRLWKELGVRYTKDNVDEMVRAKKAGQDPSIIYSRVLHTYFDKEWNK